MFLPTWLPHFLIYLPANWVMFWKSHVMVCGGCGYRGHWDREIWLWHSLGLPELAITLPFATHGSKRQYIHWPQGNSEFKPRTTANIHINVSNFVKRFIFIQTLTLCLRTIHLYFYHVFASLVFVLLLHRRSFLTRKINRTSGKNFCLEVWLWNSRQL